LESTGVGAPVADQPGGNRTREDVLRAASRLFAKRGYHGTSMRDLGDELGMLGSSLYSHVRGKNELLIEIVGRGAGFFNAVVEEANQVDASAVERLRRLICGHVHVVIGHLDEARIFLFEARFLPEGDRQKIVAMRDAYEKVYRDTIRAGIGDGTLAPTMDPGMTAIFILSVLNALIRWYRPSGDRTEEEIAAEMWSFISNGILRVASE
jgi:TetR/AcrR family transcriptional regulator, cholesterol catabolism regulator